MTDETPQNATEAGVKDGTTATPSEPKKVGGTNKLVVGIVIGMLTTVLSTALIDWLEIGASHLVYIDELPRQPEVVAAKPINGKHVMHVKTQMGFRNWGLKSGHIDRIEVVSVGLNSSPEKVEILHLDKTDIRWLRKRDITSEFIIYLDKDASRKAAENNEPLEFRIHFYGAIGNEITWQIIRMYVSFPSADGSCDKICL